MKNYKYNLDRKKTICYWKTWGYFYDNQHDSENQLCELESDF